jgi:hypothetical protein
VSTARLSALLVAAVSATLVAAPPAAAKSRVFQTPSKKIACRYESTPKPRIRCDVLWLNDVGYFLERRGKARRREVTDTVASPRARVLAYGRSLELGPFTCTSRRSGLTCRSRTSRRGFTVSRARQRTF